ncbi:MAG: GDSL-type esterase/lipase family protein [Treponema sp.]|jgi:lysophospholipase L1-like esterase|nr:GDSL-type esterase/lipase family protein [Treponema sp.]
MKTIVFYGDSNTWGFDAETGNRFPYERRWTTIAAEKLGGAYNIVVEALNGRTTVFDEPFYPYRNGRFAFTMLLDSHHPIDLLAIMLGTNDTKEFLHNRPETSSWGIRSLIRLARGGEFGPGKGDPKILIIAPPAIIRGDPSAAAFDIREFDGAPAWSAGLAEEYKKTARENGCYFLDAAPVVKVSPIDGVHIEGGSQRPLGDWIAGEILKLEF